MAPHEVDSRLRSLVGIAAHQDTINADLRTCIEHRAPDGCHRAPRRDAGPH